MMCSLASTIVRPFTGDSGPSTTDYPSPSDRAAGPDGAPNRRLASVLLAFFRKRLRPEAPPGLPSLLTHHTLARLARRHAPDAPSGARPPVEGSPPRKAEVLRAALMELRRLDAPTASEEEGPVVRSN